MKARSLLSYAVLALVGVVSAPAFAEDAKTYKLDLRDHWKVGDVATQTSKAVEAQSVLVKGPDGAVIQDQKSSRTISYQVVQKILEVNEEGAVTKSLLYFTRWSIEAGADKDDSLTGLHVEAAGLGKLRTWKVLTPGKMPSEGGKAFLDEQYGNNAGDQGGFERAMSPKKEVAVGETWDGDMAALAKDFEEKFTVDAEKSTAKMTLKGVEGTVGSFDAEISVQTTVLKSPNGDLTVKEGGAVTIKMTGTHSLEPGNNTSNGEGAIAFKAVAEANGVTVSIDNTVHRSGGTALGGEMPELKAAGG